MYQEEYQEERENEIERDIERKRERNRKKIRQAETVLIQFYVHTWKIYIFYFESREQTTFFLSRNC